MATIPADLASFSNYGQTLSVMAQGVSVPGLAMDEQTQQWAGTSFSSPLVAGLLTVVKKDFDFTPVQWETLVAISGEHRWTENSRCEELGCGAGILDGVKLYKNAERMQNGELNTANFSLNALSVCRQHWAIANLLPGQALCNQVSVAMDSFYILREREVIKLFTAAQGSAIDGDASELTWIGDFSTSHFKLEKTQLVNRDIYGQRCNVDTGVCSALEKVKSDGLDQLPEACL